MPDNDALGNHQPKDVLMTQGQGYWPRREGEVEESKGRGEERCVCVGKDMTKYTS